MAVYKSEWLNNMIYWKHYFYGYIPTFMYNFYFDITCDNGIGNIVLMNVCVCPSL